MLQNILKIQRDRKCEFLISHFRYFSLPVLILDKSCHVKQLGSKKISFTQKNTQYPFYEVAPI